MAKCAYCGTTILFGGVTDNGRRFCNTTCHQAGHLFAIADRVPQDLLAEHVVEVHQGACPRCGGPGPVDVHTSHTVWSALVLTQWRSTPQVSCRACGVKSQLSSTVLCGIFGWWGLPWGLIMTPIQIVRNVGGLLSSSDPQRPSVELQNTVKLHLASQFAAAQQQEQARQTKAP